VLRAIGTSQSPITFTSRTPSTPGSWMGIHLGVYPDGGLELDHVAISGAGAGAPGYVGSIVLGLDPGGVIRNSTISYSAGCGIILDRDMPWSGDYASSAFANQFIEVPGGPTCRTPVP
jgi:hypothetical protein